MTQDTGKHLVAWCNQIGGRSSEFLLKLDIPCDLAVGTFSHTSSELFATPASWHGV